jgi:hypothetical protein
MRHLPGDIHACEMHTRKTHAYGIHTREVHVYEVHACEIQTYEMHCHAVYAHEVYPHEMRVLEMDARTALEEISRFLTLQTVVRWSVCRVPMGRRQKTAAFDAVFGVVPTPRSGASLPSPLSRGRHQAAKSTGT